MALARALVTRPAILLLDEPLGALDEKLRIDMQAELVEIQRTLGMTFVYITHSQEEALTMSDRVVLMRSGRIEQSGAPVDLFDRPVSRFAAEFMGFENLLPGIVREAHADGRLVVAIGDVLIHGFSPHAGGAAERGRGARRRARRAAGAAATGASRAGSTSCPAGRPSSSIAANTSTRRQTRRSVRSSSGTGIARHRPIASMPWRGERKTACVLPR